MPVDFNSPEQRHAYTGREAQPAWFKMMQEIVDAQGKQVADIGCGGAIYSRAWAKLGAAQVIGLDSSPVMLADAQETTQDIVNIHVQEGSALATGLEASSQDIVFERALIHHIAKEQQLECFAEAFRILRNQGVYIIQDRTQQDVRYAGSPEHIRGYLFECFPDLLKFEAKRRPSIEFVEQGLRALGFSSVSHISFWEDRLVYPDVAALEMEFRQRKGRAILHELSDEQLNQLIAYIVPKVKAHMPLVDKDCWTLWIAKK